jgi:hypothetical protein
MDAVDIIDAVLKTEDGGIRRQIGLNFDRGGFGARTPSSMLVVAATAIRSWRRKPSSSSPSRTIASTCGARAINLTGTPERASIPPK